MLGGSTISIKNDIVLSRIEATEPGTKISVRGLASELDVSEGTVYKAIKEAEQRGLVITKPKSGTFRIESDVDSDSCAVTLSELVSALGVSCAAGRKSLGCTIDNIVICDSDEAQLLSRLEYADPSRTLCIVGKRPDFQTLIIQSRAHMLITGGGRPSDYHIVKAEKNGVCILTALQNTYAIMKLFDSQFSSARLADEDAPVSEWMQAPNYLYRNDYVADWQRYYDEQFPGMRSFPVVEGVFYASDLIRYFMYLGTESMSDYASFLVPAPEYSNEDRRVYELRVPEAELANMDILPTALMLVAADKHLAQQGCLDCALSSSSFFYPEQITQVGGLMLCTALTSNGKAGFSVEAEVYTETATFAKAMLIFTER